MLHLRENKYWKRIGKIQKNHAAHQIMTKFPHTHTQKKKNWTYGIQRGNKLTQRVQKGCNTYFDTMELSTPLYLCLRNAATPCVPMYPILFFSLFFSRMISPQIWNNNKLPIYKNDPEKRKETTKSLVKKLEQIESWNLEITK